MIGIFDEFQYLMTMELKNDQKVQNDQNKNDQISKMIKNLK